jgi:hypothetical protein
MATPFLHLARGGKVLSPVTLVPLPSPRPFLPRPAVTGPLGQGILHRGPEAVPQGLQIL